MPDNRFTRRIRTGDPSGDVPAPTLRALLRAVRDAEVLYLAFPRIERALVIDTRPGAADSPAALVAPLAYGAGARAAVERLRPGRPPSDRQLAATWGGSTRAFADQGMLAAILARLPADERAVLAAFEQLREAESPPPPVPPMPPTPSE